MMTAQRTRRDDPAYVTPEDLPREFRQYDVPVPILGAGEPGKVGLIELEVARHGDVSRIVHRYQRAPLQFFQPIYLDPVRRDMPFVVLLQQGGGMLQGDRYRLDITCHAGAAMHVTTQSANKLYKCEANYITQIVNITAAAGSVVEYLPDVTIPYRHSRFFQRMDLHVDPEATVIVGEVLTAGRVAYGERHAYDIFANQTNAYALDGRLLAADTVKLQPGISPTANPALLGPYDAFGFLSVFSRRCPPGQLTALLRAALAADPKTASRTVAGVSELPNGCGVAVRILGSTGAAVEHARTVAWNAVRIALLDAPAPDLRKA
ncbi:MAG: urease accessory protein UreD [Thermomicrobiales bacterium]|nr:urease accessory protein UreD [Thermomicrobiales bacterium]